MCATKQSREAVMVTGVRKGMSYEKKNKKIGFNLRKKQQSGKKIVLRYIYSSEMRKGIICASREWQTIVNIIGLNYSKAESCSLFGKLVVRLIQHWN